MARFFSIFAVMKALEQIIEKCLLIKGRVILPHWGILTIHRSSASMDKNEGWMYPPSEEISFLEFPQLGTEELENELSQFVFSQPVDIAQLASRIADFAKDMKEAGSWSLGRLGQFEVGPQQIAWHSAPASNWSLLADLPDIRLPHPRPAGNSGQQGTQTVVSSAAATPDVDPVSTETDSDASSSRSLFIVLILVLVLALVMVIGSLMYWGPLTNSSTTKVDFPVQKERMNVHPEELSSAIKRTSDTQILEEDSAPFELDHRTPVIESESNPADPSKDETESEIPESTAESNTTPTESEIKESSDCVIIVGAFYNQGNVQQMQDRLAESGYDLYSASSGSLVRVGVYAPCPSSEILKELRTIRREIEPAAWILNE